MVLYRKMSKYIFYIRTDPNKTDYRFESANEMEEYIYNHNLPEDALILVKIATTGVYLGDILVTNYKKLNEKSKPNATNH